MKGRQLGGRRRVAGWVEREGSPAGWKAKGHRKRRELNITGELSFIGDTSAQWSASSALRSRRWSVAVELQLVDKAQQWVERRDRRAERRIRDAEALSLSFSSLIKLNGDTSARRSRHWSVVVELHRQRLAQRSLSATVFLFWVFLVQFGFFFFFFFFD